MKTNRRTKITKKTKKGGSRKKSASQKGPRPTSPDIKEAQDIFLKTHARHKKNENLLKQSGKKLASSSQNTQPMTQNY
jgi:hypothetical protein